MKYINSFLLLLQFITRIPVNKSLPCEKEDFKRSSFFFAVVGLVIGSIQFGTYFLLKNIFPMNIMAIFIIIEEIVLTGGFHIDGLGDTCDGFFAEKGKDKIIGIMKDSRIGTFSGIAIVIDILIKYAAYYNLLDAYPSGLFILLIPMISRAALCFMAYIGKSAKKTGLGNLFIDTVDIKSVLVNYCVCIGLGMWIINLPKIIIGIAIVGTCLITILFYTLCKSKINGITGDSLGATNELASLVLLIILNIHLPL